MNYLRTAVLGIDDASCLLLETASKIPYFQIRAVADKDTKLAEKIAAEYQCTAYDDYRQLIIQNQFDCLLVAAGMHSCDEYVRMAMKKKCNVLKLSPPARNFEEAAEFVRLAESENVKFAIANPGRFSAGFTALKQFIQQGGIEQIFLITAVCAAGNQNFAPWETDPRLSGGGVLLRNSYQLIDQLMCNFEIPQHVYCLTTNQATDKKQRLYLTEDIAVLTLKFSDTCFGSLLASRQSGIGTEKQIIKVYGKDKILTAGNNQFSVCDGTGQICEQYNYDENPSDCTKKVLENFALGILMPDKNRICSSAGENLRNMALIESAYLSARTGMPEEPARILRMAQVEPIILWPAGNK
jgi:predicted dehydrogenase